MRIRTILAAATAPLIGGIVSATLMTLVMRDGLWVGALSAGLLGGALVGWPAMLLAGLPAHYALIQYKHTNWIVYLARGLTIGALVGSLVSAWFVDIQRDPAPPCCDMAPLPEAGAEFVVGMPIGALAGALTGIWFWLVSRPDRVSA